MLKIFRGLFSTRKKDVDETKDKYVSDMLKIHVKARAQVRSSQELLDCVENSVAYRIARATGRMKK